jgi:hypothetical protein
MRAFDLADGTGSAYRSVALLRAAHDERQPILSSTTSRPLFQRPSTRRMGRRLSEASQ